MRRSTAVLLIALGLLALLSISVYAASCGAAKPGAAGGCGMKAAGTQTAGCGMKAAGGCGMQAAAGCPNAAKMSATPTPSLTRVLSAGTVTVKPAGRGMALITVTDKSGKVDAKASVSAALDGKGLAVRKVGPGTFAVQGARGSELAVRVSSLSGSEVAYFSAGSGGGCAACPMQGKCGMNGACPCGAECKCEPGKRSADCKCGEACKCGAGCKAMADGKCTGMESGKCQQAGQCRKAAAGCGGCAK